MGSVCSNPAETKATETVTVQPDVKEVKEVEEVKDVASAMRKITVFGCRGLRNADWTWMPASMGGGQSDAYVICKDKGTGKELLTTKIIPNSLEPIFDEEFEVDFSSDSTLEFTVYDKDPLKSDLLGRVELNGAELAQGFNGELPLGEAGKDIKAYIKILVTAPGGEYPPGPPTHFDITVEKGDFPEYGLECDDSIGDVLFVTKIAEGKAVEKYNNDKDTTANQLIKVGQYISAVNGIKDPKGMVEQLETASKVVLSMVRPQCFTIAVKKTGPFGLTLGSSTKSVVIKAVMPGPIHEWNKTNNEKVVKANDRIVGVNGKRPVETAMLKQDGTFQLVISRPCSQEDSATFFKGFFDWF